tara:strand:- start:369 stop:617 length:249 start_codon:yes stop_codon:yes gene_type:complete
MTDTRHNGWTNYATWRINLEMFDGLDLDRDVDAGELEQSAYDTIIDDGNDLAIGYALAFISDVNWHEIADGINDARKEVDNV